MRKRGRVDSNHNEIVDALRAHGASVTSIANIGGGCPDLLVGTWGNDYKRYNILMEVKDEKGQLTEDERKWHLLWRGSVYIVRSPKQALEVLKFYEEHQ